MRTILGGVAVVTVVVSLVACPVPGPRKCTQDGDCAGYAFCDRGWCTLVSDAGTDGGSTSDDGGTSDAGPPMYGWLFADVQQLSATEYFSSVNATFYERYPLGSCNLVQVEECTVRICPQGAVPSRRISAGTMTWHGLFDGGELTPDASIDYRRSSQAMEPPDYRVQFSFSGDEFPAFSTPTVHIPPSLETTGPTCLANQACQFARDAGIDVSWTPIDGDLVNVALIRRRDVNTGFAISAECFFAADAGQARIPPTVLNAFGRARRDAGDSPVIFISHQRQERFDGGGWYVDAVLDNLNTWAEFDLE